MSPLNITQPLPNIRYMVFFMATIRWCPIYPKWDSYQPPILGGEWGGVVRCTAPLAIFPTSSRLEEVPTSALKQFDEAWRKQQQNKLLFRRKLLQLSTVHDCPCLCLSTGLDWILGHAIKTRSSATESFWSSCCRPKGPSADPGLQSCHHHSFPRPKSQQNRLQESPQMHAVWHEPAGHFLADLGLQSYHHHWIYCPMSQQSHLPG